MPSLSSPWRLARFALGSALLLPLIVACTMGGLPVETARAPLTSPVAPAGDDVLPLGYAEEAPARGAGMNAAIGRYAALYEVPEGLIRRIIVRESQYNPHARNGPYWGLMQIRYDTARSMGYGGPAAGLLDADTNLRYGVKYLAGAYKVASGNPDRAVGFYASGYFYDARRMGLLEEVGLKRGKH